jgi:hypothetical protein
LAQIADTVTAIGDKMEGQSQVQQTILAVLQTLLETNQAQSEMLADILAAASEDAGPSPVAEALEALVAQIQRLDENQTNLIALVAELPEAIGRQFEISLKATAAVTPAQP